MSNDTAIQAFIEYLEESDAPEANWPRCRFEEACFSRWAAGELIHAILDCPTVPAKNTIEEFAIKMTAYSSLSDGMYAGRIFSIAAQFAHEALEIFREDMNT